MKKICKCGAEFTSLTCRKKYCALCTMEINRIKNAEYQRRHKSKCSDCFNCKKFDCILPVNTHRDFIKWQKEVEYN